MKEEGKWIGGNGKWCLAKAGRVFTMFLTLSGYYRVILDDPGIVVIGSQHVGTFETRDMAEARVADITENW